MINSVVAKRIALGVPYYTESKWCQIKEELTKLGIVLVAVYKQILLLCYISARNEQIQGMPKHRFSCRIF
jgi:hypothetical protein